MVFEIVGTLHEKPIREEIDGDHLSVVRFDEDPHDKDVTLNGLVVEIQDEEDVCVGVAYLVAGMMIRKKR